MATFAYGQLLYTYASLRASRTVHTKLVNSLLKSTFRYLSYSLNGLLLALRGLT